MARPLLTVEDPSELTIRNDMGGKIGFLRRYATWRDSPRAYSWVCMVESKILPESKYLRALADLVDAQNAKEPLREGVETNFNQIRDY